MKLLCIAKFITIFPEKLSINNISSGGGGGGKPKANSNEQGGRVLKLPKLKKCYLWIAPYPYSAQRIFAPP